MTGEVTHGSMTISTTEDPATVSAALTELDARSTQITPPAETPAEPVAEPPANQDTTEQAQTLPIDREQDGRFKAKDGKKDPAEKRIAKVTWQREEAMRENARLQEEIQALRAKASGTAPAEPTATPTGKPTSDQFASYDEFTEALAEWKLDQKLAALDAKKAEQRVEQVLSTRERSYLERLADTKAEMPDYDQVLAPVADRKLLTVVQEAILDAESGPRILYYLAAHPEVMDQLDRDFANVPLSAAPAVRAYLETLAAPAATRGSAPPATVRQTVPAPITPLGAGPVTPVSDPNDLPFGRAYVDRMNARDLERHRKKFG
jgi:hypothetical protein